MVVEYVLKMIQGGGEDCMSNGLEKEGSVVTLDSVRCQIESHFKIKKTKCYLKKKKKQGQPVQLHQWLSLNTSLQ